jgi:hypothetical protein
MKINSFNTKILVLLNMLLLIAIWVFVYKGHKDMEYKVDKIGYQLEIDLSINN